MQAENDFLLLFFVFWKYLFYKGEKMTENIFQTSPRFNPQDRIVQVIFEKNKELLMSKLFSYRSDYSEENVFKTRIMNFITTHPDAFERSCKEGHITGSAWLLNPDGRKVLLTHHRKLNRWLQLGGHSDGNADTAAVALREATEESGIQGIRFVSKDIFDIDIHPIPKNLTKGEGPHFHYDIRFLLQAPTENFVVSNESKALRWMSLSDLAQIQSELTPSILRMMEKWKQLKL